MGSYWYEARGKMHEILIPEDEARNVLEFDKHFVVQPIQSFWGNKIGILGGRSCPKIFDMQVM